MATRMDHSLRDRTVKFPSVLGLLLVIAGCASDHDPDKAVASKTGGAAGESSDSGGSGGNPTGAGGSSAAGGGAAGGPVMMLGCPGGPIDTFCAPLGFPFVGATFPISEMCGAADCVPILTQPEPGTLCLSGPAPEAGVDNRLLLPHFPLILDMGPGRPPGTQLDAPALGIAQVKFTFKSKSLPPGGILVNGGINLPPGKVIDGQIPPNLAFGFYLPPIVEDGPTLWSLDDFVQYNRASEYQTFDPHKIGSINFGAGDGPYDFCVSDFKFLDANGDEVMPPEAP
jgi:hypothetical protein